MGLEPLIMENPRRLQAWGGALESYQILAPDPKLPSLIRVQTHKEAEHRVATVKAPFKYVCFSKGSHSLAGWSVLWIQMSEFPQEGQLQEELIRTMPWSGSENETLHVGSPL